MTARSFDPRARRQARRLLMQALYAWQMAGTELAKLRDQFTAADQMRGGDECYFLTCLHGVVGSVDELDPLFAPYLDRAVDRLDYVERAILRAGVYELKERLDVPVRVVIDEWVELAKGFGAEESFRYVNGVLDRVARNLRRVEIEAP